MRVVSISAGVAQANARRDALVAEHIGLVRAIAARLIVDLPPSFDFEDLVGAGNIALVALAGRYRPSEHEGTPFSAYARIRIRGAMLDSVKRRRYDETTCPPLDEAPEPWYAPVIETEIDHGRLRRRVAAMVEELPAAQRRAIHLVQTADDARRASSNDYKAAIAALKQRKDRGRWWPLREHRGESIKVA